VSHLAPISATIEAGRDPSAPVSFRLSDGRVRSWGDFAVEVAEARRLVRERKAARWVLFCDDCYVFAVALSALLREGACVLLPGGTQAGLVEEIRGDDAALIGDGAFEAGSGPSLDLRALVDARPRAGADGLGPSRASDASLTLFTSGSTGKPKAVLKRPKQLEAEIANLHALWGADLEGRVLYSTVSQQHIYGLLFFGILPICSGTVFCSERLAYPESMAVLADRPSALVASPAFLKRAVESGIAPLPRDRAVVSFSSGGFLPEGTAAAAGAILGMNPMEIFGSSETGGISYRRSASGLPWAPFKGIDLRTGDGGRIEVRSAYLAETGFIATGDLGELTAEGGLVLLGRADSVVKIEEKRVSLADIEARLRESPLVADAYALALRSAGRQIIGVAVLPSREGGELLSSGGRRALSEALRSALGRYFEAVLLPRKWRFVDAMPVNEQGKVRMDAARALFEPARRPYELVSAEYSGERARLELRFPEDCPYFEGHFPSFKILPAVAQIDIVVRIAAERFGSTTEMLGMPRIKFQKPIRPGADYGLTLDYDPARGRIGFEYVELATGESCSSGKLDMGARS
jgi:acyl-coenzyme A synthetase/AMP-(fatty) acid ligase/3-hydroxymyristoyl/3-hydroxydecanoyl-(acyl carrier protein) dehydratase